VDPNTNILQIAFFTPSGSQIYQRNNYQRLK